MWLEAEGSDVFRSSSLLLNFPLWQRAEMKEMSLLAQDRQGRRLVWFKVAQRLIREPSVKPPTVVPSNVLKVHKTCHFKIASHIFLIKLCLLPNSDRFWRRSGQRSRDICEWKGTKTFFFYSTGDDLVSLYLSQCLVSFWASSIWGDSRHGCNSIFFAMNALCRPLFCWCCLRASPAHRFTAATAS